MAGLVGTGVDALFLLVIRGLFGAPWTVVDALGGIFLVLSWLPYLLTSVFGVRAGFAVGDDWIAFRVLRRWQVADLRRVRRIVVQGAPSAGPSGPVPGFPTPVLPGLPGTGRGGAASWTFVGGGGERLVFEGEGGTTFSIDATSLGPDVGGALWRAIDVDSTDVTDEAAKLLAGGGAPGGGAGPVLPPPAEGGTGDGPASGPGIPGE